MQWLVSNTLAPLMTDVMSHPKPFEMWRSEAAEIRGVLMKMGNTLRLRPAPSPGTLITAIAFPEQVHGHLRYVSHLRITSMSRPVTAPEMSTVYLLVRVGKRLELAIDRYHISLHLEIL